MKDQYHGWIVVEQEEGFRPHFHCEQRSKRLASFRSPAEAIEWWDQHLGQKILLLPTPIGAYRVYTQKEEINAAG